MRAPQLGVLAGLCLSTVAFAQSPEDPLLVDALVAAGAADEAEVTQLAALFHARVDPIVREVRGQPAGIAAQLLLRHLHLRYASGSPMLVKYQLDAFSLKELLLHGNFNCLSATTLFVLAARQAGLEVKAELYSDHARAVFAIRGQVFQIEATSAFGFDADPAILKSSGRLQDGALSLEFPRDASTDELISAIATSAGGVAPSRSLSHGATFALR